MDAFEVLKSENFFVHLNIVIERNRASQLVAALVLIDLRTVDKLHHRSATTTQSGLSCVVSGSLATAINCFGSRKLILPHAKHVLIYHSDLAAGDVDFIFRILL